MLKHAASESEAGIMREIFGPEVAQVVFWGAGGTGEGFDWIEGQEVGGVVLAAFGPDDERWGREIDEVCLGDIPGDRGETVTFIVVIR